MAAKQPDPVEEWAVEKFRHEFRKARAAMEKGVQQAADTEAQASANVELKAKRDSATGDYELSLKLKGIKLPGDEHVEKIRLAHGRFEMIQGEMFPGD